MLNELRKNRSLTFYQIPSDSIVSKTTSVHTGGIIATGISLVENAAVGRTANFNNQLNVFLRYLSNAREIAAKEVRENLAIDPNHQAARNKGVSLAWKYEKADIEMGGKGSSDWNKQEQNEILNRGTVRGAEGHHQKNVAAHPEEQANPDNIKFYRTRKEHLEKGHGGDFHNESDAPMIDKDAMLKRTNRTRVIKNELRGCGIAVAIASGVGFTIGFAVTLAQSGISPEALKYAVIEGGKSSVSSGAMAAVGYGIGRTIGEIAKNASIGILKNLGIEITDNISKMCSMGTVGAITILAFSTYQFIKLIRSGMSTKQAVIQVGKEALFSLSLLAVSIIAQGLWGGCAGLVVSISSGIIIISYHVADIVHQKDINEKVRVFMIDKCKPILAA